MSMELKVFSFVGSCAASESRTARFSDMVGHRLAELCSTLGKSVNYERLDARDLRISFCRSCGACFSTGACPLDDNDDMPLVKRKMLEADILLFCSPVYAGSLSGVSKCVIDRLTYWTHRFELAGKPTAILVTASGNHGTETADQIAEVLSYLGVALAYKGCAYRKGSPNIYLPEEMQPEVDEACTALLGALASPERYITPFQESAFVVLRASVRQQLAFARMVGREPSSEGAVWQERGMLKSGGLARYVASHRPPDSEES